MRGTACMSSSTETAVGVWKHLLQSRVSRSSTRHLKRLQKKLDEENQRNQHTRSLSPQRNIPHVPQVSTPFFLLPFIRKSLLVLIIKRQPYPPCRRVRRG